MFASCFFFFLQLNWCVYESCSAERRLPHYIPSHDTYSLLSSLIKRRIFTVMNRPTSFTWEPEKKATKTFFWWKNTFLQFDWMASLYRCVRCVRCVFVYFQVERWTVLPMWSAHFWNERRTEICSNIYGRMISNSFLLPLVSLCQALEAELND